MKTRTIMIAVFAAKNGRDAFEKAATVVRPLNGYALGRYQGIWRRDGRRTTSYMFSDYPERVLNGRGWRYVEEGIWS
jgi:hypothetical protein